MRLRLRRHTFKLIKRALHRRGRVAVQITARVKGARGAGKIRRRILIKSPRAARHGR
jgi:hypothetical protein